MKKIFISLLFATTVSFISFTASADSITLNVESLSLDNVDDAAGRWQHSGGNVKVGETQIGNYALHRRVTISGTSPLNTSMFTMTIFLSDTGNPPENITIQGAHSFNNGGYTGSVSAASANLAGLIGADIDGSTTTDTLTITW